jgi:hypothetical protein
MQMLNDLKVAPHPLKVRFPDPTRIWQSSSVVKAVILG